MVTGELNGLRLIDVGTGAGFPGIPLILACPDLKLTLVDSTTKKTKYLESIIERLNLKNVDIINERIEVLGQDFRYRAQFDWAVARAVASLPTLAEYLLPLVKISGKMLAMKSEGITQEYEESLTVIKKLGGEEGVIQEVQYDLETNSEREVSSHYLLTITKLRNTPSEYPRRIGVPKKTPLA